MSSKMNCGAEGFTSNRCNSDGAKLHMIVDTITTDASGNATLKIEPSLKTALSDDEVVTYSNTKMVARMDSNELGWQSDVNGVYQISFACSEAL